MTITSVTPDSEALTLTVIADFTVRQRRLWDAYLDPRQIEQFWGPELWPATFARHDGFPGGRSDYAMTGPDGERSAGYWEWIEVDAPHRFSVRDGFVGEGGTPSLEMPSMRMEFDFSETAEGSRLVTTTYFDSREEFEQLIEMGMVEGTESAMNQIDAVVEDEESFASDRSTHVQLLGDNQARITRVVRGELADVWQAHTDAHTLRKWQLGPEGWSMPACEYSAEPGASLRLEWQNDETSERFGFVGEVLESRAPWRLVTTERMVSPADPKGDESFETVNEFTLTSLAEGTLAVYVITYPDAEARTTVLETGMAEGMELSYSRLEREVLGGVA